MTNEPDRGDTPPPASPLRRVAALVLPAAIGAGVALGVVGATVGFGGDTTTIIREGGGTVLASAPAESSRIAESGEAAKALSVSQLVKRESPAVVLVTVDDASGGGGLGSGFLIDRKGHILTNAHVVESGTSNGAKTSVTFSDGTVEKADILGVDKSTDLAVLRVADVPKGVQPAPLGSSAGLVVGQEVVAIGNPYGLERTATTGIVSALKRAIESPNNFTIQNAIQTDAAINQGNSGGPLYDMAGRVVGMNSQIASQNGGNVGIGFAVPIDTIKPIAEAVINKGTVQHAWIGISGRELTPALAEKLGLEGKRGVLVAETMPDSPAREEGIEAAEDPKAEVPKGADLIVAVNGQRVVDMADVSQAVASRRVGEKITVTVLRDGQERTITLTLKDRPSGLGVR